MPFEPMLFKLDENLGDRGLKRLREAGHDVMTVREQQLCGQPDSRVLDICTAEKRCLMTLDIRNEGVIHESGCSIRRDNAFY